MMDLKPKDLIALIVILCFVFLTFNGVNSPMTDLIGVLVGYYFGHRRAGVDSGV